MNKLNLIPTTWTTGWTDIFDTGTWRSAFPEYQHRPSPCHNACPVDGEIATWIQHVREDNYYDGWLALIKNNPFPAITGRICHHPCQVACNRNHYDETVAINALEQFIGDMAIAQNWQLPLPKNELPKSIAIIGGGPAGLSTAYQLRQAGYQVTVFEAQSELGGILRYGIPEYRLPKKVLANEINRLIATGIKVVVNSPLSAPEEFSKLQDEYDAIFLATGAQLPKKLPGLDYQAPWVIDGLNFLQKTNRGETLQIGRRVVVVGGGSAAMDVARTARRQGHQVNIIALESKDTMPAQTEEIQEALEEGITIYDGAMITSFLSLDKGVTLECVKVTIAQDSPPGVLKPIPVENSSFTLETDTLIPAIGQDPDLPYLVPMLETAGPLIKVDGNYATSIKNVFAGGDAASLERFASIAIGNGKRSAQCIHQALDNGKPIQSHGDLDNNLDEVSFESINTFYFTQAPKANKITTSALDRVKDFLEFKQNITQSQAQLEAVRCFSCGNCLNCDNCFYFCPDMAVKKDPSGEGYTVLEQYCKGCGLCAEECPRGVLSLKEEIR